MNKTPDQLRSEIQGRLGSFPAIFEPATNSPEILQNLWLQTQQSYLDNPLPPLFKEKLSALLARFCEVSHCLIFHTARLHSLGMHGTDVLKLLQSPELSIQALTKKAISLGLSKPATSIPPESELESCVLQLAISLYLHREVLKCQSKLKELLAPDLYQHLTILISYNRTTFTWSESHPEVAEKLDPQSQAELDLLLAEEPRLSVFFEEYLQRACAFNLTNAHENLIHLFRQTPELFCILAGPNHVFEFANEAEVSMLGFDPTGMSVQQAQPESVEIHSILDKVFESGISTRVIESGITVGNRVRYFDLTFAARRDSHERINGVMILGSEVTHRVQARRDLQANEARLNQAVRAAQLGFWEYDIEQDIVTYSSVLRQQWDLALTADTLEAVLERIYPEDRHIVSFAIDQVRVTGRPYTIEYRVMNSNGKIIWIQGHGEPVFDINGRVIRVRGTSLDITRPKMAEEELRSAKEAAEIANESKTQFLTSISHELRTPLGVISGFLSLMKKPKLPRANFDYYLRVVEKNAAHLIKLVDDLLDLSKVEAGRMTTESIEFSLRELLHDIAATFEFRAREKGIEFRWSAGTPLPERILCDPTRIRQIIGNMLSNALKFTEKGHVSLTVSYEVPHLRFTVEDTGIGIAREAQARLFRPFQQAEMSTTRRFGGTGLGLVLARHLCEALDGSFDLVRSEPGEGSVFSARILPRAVVDGVILSPEEFVTRAPIAPAPAGEISRRLAGMSLLVVEDSLDNQELFQALLTEAGATVEIASDGEEGVEKALAGSYDVVLMDIQMPRRDGYSAARKLRKHGFKTPLVALTAHAMKDEKDRCLNAGFSHFLSKPIELERMISLLQSINEGKAVPEKPRSRVAAALPGPGIGPEPGDSAFVMH